MANFEVVPFSVSSFLLNTFVLGKEIFIRENELRNFTKKSFIPKPDFIFDSNGIIIETNAPIIDPDEFILNNHILIDESNSLNSPILPCYINLDVMKPIRSDL